MAKIILYSTNCPKCKMLERRLNERNIEFEINTDVDLMLSLGIKSAPVLSVDGNLLDFAKAWSWATNTK